MDIKKVDDKPMDIHIKERIKLHKVEPKKASIKNGRFSFLRKVNSMENTTVKKKGTYLCNNSWCKQPDLC